MKLLTGPEGWILGHQNWRKALMRVGLFQRQVRRIGPLKHNDHSENPSEKKIINDLKNYYTH